MIFLGRLRYYGSYRLVDLGEAGLESAVLSLVDVCLVDDQLSDSKLRTAGQVALHEMVVVEEEVVELGRLLVPEPAFQLLDGAADFCDDVRRDDEVDDDIR